jgi:hypothetical protein
MGLEHGTTMEDSQGVTLARDKEITRVFSHLGLVLNEVSSTISAPMLRKLNKKIDPLLLRL